MTLQSTLIPNSFQTPNAFIDHLMFLLDGDEFKILAFATRHILGWKDRVESRQHKISLTMFVEGFKDQSGNEYHGTGLSRPRANKALKALVEYRVLIPIGESDNAGQAWKLPIDDPDIDYKGLEQRAQSKKNKNQQRVKKAAQVSAGKRRKARAGTADVPLRQYDTRTTSGTADVPAGGTTDVPAGGTTDVPKQTHKQTNMQTQVESPNGDSGDPEKIINPFKEVQTVIINEWFAGDWQNAGWAGKLTHMFMGTSDDAGYKDYNFDPAFDAKMVGDWAKWMKGKLPEIPTSPETLMRWKSKFLDAMAPPKPPKILHVPVPQWRIDAGLEPDLEETA